MSQRFKDHFSHGSDEYSRYRPTYPGELFTWLRDQLPDATAVWDCGCGTGQASVLLADHFPQVFATDPSASQLDNAISHERVRYSIGQAEASGLNDQSVDLVTVAQAYHWFDFDGFRAEVERVLKSGGLVAVLTYNLPVVKGMDTRAFMQFYNGTVGQDWQPERDHVDRAYSDLPFPFARLPIPDFPMLTHWDFARFFGYIGTWSAVGKYRKRTGHDPMPAFREELLHAWGEPDVVREIDWRLTVLLGKI